MRRRLLGLLLVAALVVAGGPAVAAERLEITEVELVPADGTRFTVRDRHYGGSLVVRVFPEGLFLAERVAFEDYLLGIREVPFSWPEEALAAQVVAARTYVLNRMAGRSGDAERYGYDICATSACQVYRGVGGVDVEGGDRWRAAVERTRDEVLLHRGRPAEAVYSASAGRRTRANQDIWGGAPIPYLQPVDSPEEGVSPWYEWRFDVDPDAFVSILRAAGVEVEGRLADVHLDEPGEGKGRAELVLTTDAGVVRIPAVDLKGILNRRADDLYPGAFPARYEGRRLPQTLPSYSYDIRLRSGPTPDAARLLPDEDEVGAVEIVGEGWGHGVGLSQWGAKAMADAGADYREILAHYYGGLEPTEAPDLVPDEVVVALAKELESVVVEADGPFELRVDGEVLAAPSGGRWRFVHVGDEMLVVPPLEFLDFLRRFVAPWAL